MLMTLPTVMISHWIPHRSVQQFCSLVLFQNDFTTPMSKNKKKSPWMTCDGVEVADSQICLEYLNRMYRKDFNSHLNQEQRAISRAFQKMVEENTYWYEMGMWWSIPLLLRLCMHVVM